MPFRLFRLLPASHRSAPLKTLALIAAACAFLWLPSFAAAQTAPPASNLDVVQKAGVLRICTPGDYKPFSFQKANG